MLGKFGRQDLLKYSRLIHPPHPHHFMEKVRPRVESSR